MDHRVGFRNDVAPDANTEPWAEEPTPEGAEVGADPSGRTNAQWAEAKFRRALAEIRAKDRAP